MGLASYSTLQRTKEIGVRKVIGASTGGIVLLLSKDFLKLVGWAFLIAAPLSWFFIHGWLQGFAYRIPVYWRTFAVAGLMAFLIASLTISFQAIRAAMANPVKSILKFHSFDPGSIDQENFRVHGLFLYIHCLIDRSGQFILAV